MSKNRFELDSTTILSKSGKIRLTTCLTKEQLEVAITAATEKRKDWDLLGFIEELKKFEDIEVETAVNEPLQIDDFDIDEITEI